MSIENQSFIIVLKIKYQSNLYVNGKLDWRSGLTNISEYTYTIRFT